ncbi:MAG: fatty-acid--CoA ligase [Desulfobacterales bacterium RIFOXYA12_FULL_46_15]|nr:MAG: fatty-acid--CoA ligase [Desulfobacterales bacterium RIFOXYA12_FULL_46_15]
MQLTSIIKRAAQVNPRGLATVYKDRKQTWPQLVERVGRLAGALQKAGMKTGDRVAMLGMNSDRFIEYLFGVMWGGGVVMPMNLRWAPPESAYAIDNAGVKILIVDDAFEAMVPAIRERTGNIKTVIFAGDRETPMDMMNYEEILEAADPVPDAGRGNEDLAGIFYTGGTTGFPKGAMLPHRGIYSSSLSCVWGFDLTDRASYLHAAPMFHMADIAMMISTCLAAGTHIIIPMFNPEATLEAIEAHRPTHVLLVPVMIRMMLESPEFDKTDVSSLKRIIYGASSITESLLVKAMEKFAGCGFAQGFGQTELSPVCTILDAKHHVLEGPYAGKLRSAGQATNTCEIKIVDPAGNELPAGKVGEILVKGPITMLGYWNNPDQTAATITDGWVHMGDGGYLDDDGFLFVVDRLKDMIVSGGENVYSAEVENAVTQHPDVAACAVIGIPSKKWGESVHAIVILNKGAKATEDDIKKFCHTLIAGYKCPWTVEFRTEPFPLSAANKVLKTELRKPFWEGRTRRVN